MWPWKNSRLSFGLCQRMKDIIRNEMEKTERKKVHPGESKGGRGGRSFQYKNPRDLGFISQTQTLCRQVIFFNGILVLTIQLPRTSLMNVLYGIIPKVQKS